MIDDGRQVVVAGLPAELRANEVRFRHHLDGVAAPPRSDPALEIAPGDLLDRVEHLLDRVAAAVAAIDDEVFPAGAQVAKRCEVRPHQIGDVDVVAHAGPVHGRIVVAEDLDEGADAERGLGRDLDEQRRLRGRLPVSALGSAPATLK